MSCLCLRKPFARELLVHALSAKEPRKPEADTSEPPLRAGINTVELNPARTDGRIYSKTSLLVRGVHDQRLKELKTQSTEVCMRFGGAPPCA